MKILTTADWHLRDTVPSCVDCTLTEWIELQREALHKIFEISIENGVSGVYQCGDIFHTEKTTSFEIIQMVQDFGKMCFDEGINFFIIAGNHDEIYHSSINLCKSAIGILFKSKFIKDMMSDESLVRGCNFDIENYEEFEFIAKHVLCIPENEKPSFIECETPETLLTKFKSARFIFTGDYHRNFVHKGLDNRYVINSGCLTKQASDFADYETGVYVTDLETCDVKWCPVNIKQKFVKNGNSAKVDKSVEDFVNGIKKESVTLDFIGTLRNELTAQKKDVQDKVEGWIENIGQ